MINREIIRKRRNNPCESLTDFVWSLDKGKEKIRTTPVEQEAAFHLEAHMGQSAQD